MRFLEEERVHVEAEAEQVRTALDLAPLVALEIGTSKVRALVGRARDDNHLSVIGMGECPSRGVRKSEVVEFESAVACTRLALQSAAENCNAEIRDVHLLAGGGHILSLVNSASLPVMGPSQEITRDDIQRVMDVARTVNLPPEREILHTICQHFTVDARKGVLQPEGLEGRTLELDMLIVHGIRTRLKNTIRAARAVPVEILDVAFSGLCAALGVLTPEQKESGVLVIDLGGGTTSYVAYAGGAIALAGCLGVGGDHVTNDVAQGLRVPRAQAEMLKERHGSAIVEAASRNQRVELAAEGGVARRYFRLGDLQMITHLRMEETLDMVKHQLDRLDLLNLLGAGVVLTGGGAYLRRVTELAERVFGMPCAVGSLRDLSGLSLAGQVAEYAAVVGMLRYAARLAAQEEPGETMERLKARLRRLFGFGW